MGKLSNKKAKSNAREIARRAVKNAGVASKRGKVVKRATKAALKRLKKGKLGKARKAARRVANDAV